MLGYRFGHFLDRPLLSLARCLNVNPNLITVTGFLVTSAAALVLSRDLFWGGVLILLGGCFDILDGVVARANNRSTAFGAFLDSVLDRYADSFLFLGLAWYFYQNSSISGVCISLMSMVGALLVSYTRARAEGLGRDCTVGIMERPERIVLLAFGAMSGWILPVLWLMAVLTHVTVMQRIWHVRKLLKT